MLRSFLLSLIVLSLPACAADKPASAEPAAGYGQPLAPSPEPAKGTPRITFTECHVEGPYIAFTFDDGPHPTQTPRVLKMLKERNIKATFFCLGDCVAQNPDVAKQIVEEGHEIANHSWNHPQLSKMGEASVKDQLGRAHNVIKQTTGVTPTLMRPPYGAFTATQRTWAHAAWNYKCILWDVDSLDWKHRAPAKTESIIVKETKGGSIILCHDIHKTTIDAMPATLDALLAKGFKFVTVTELVKMHREPETKKKAHTSKPATAPPTPATPAGPDDSKKQPQPAPGTPAAPASGAAR